MHNNILVAVVQSGLLFLGDAERMCMIFINEVIKKCLFIQSKCHDLESVAGNPTSVPHGDGRPSLGTCTLHVRSLSDQVLIRKPLQGGLLGAVSLPIKIKQGTFLRRKLSIEPGGETRLELGRRSQSVLEPLGGPGPGSPCTSAPGPHHGLEGPKRGGDAVL